jgi:hypothetical protein
VWAVGGACALWTSGSTRDRGRRWGGMEFSGGAVGGGVRDAVTGRRIRFGRIPFVARGRKPIGGKELGRTQVTIMPREVREFEGWVVRGVIYSVVTAGKGTWFECVLQRAYNLRLCASRHAC